MKAYTFKVELFLTGHGDTPEEAWHDYLETIDIRDVMMDQINSETLPPIEEKYDETD